MAKSTKSRRANKPAKPSKDFPLFAHQNGQWAKKVRGKLCYFGLWADPEAALQLWLEQKDPLLAGPTPRRKTDELTVKELADRFMTAKLNKVETGELTQVTYRDYLYVLKHVADFFGRQRPVADLAADDFSALRTSFAKIHGPHRLGKDVVVTRSLFKWGWKMRLIEQAVWFGPNFEIPARKMKLKATRAHGRKDFSADELRRVLDAAPDQLRCMILLGINSGLGQSDIANLKQSHVDLDSSWLVFPRPKTEVERRCPLWLETIQALREVLATRPQPKDAGDRDYVFLTDRGQRVVRITEFSRTDSMRRPFGKLLKTLDINGKRAFYSLRHTFETQAGESKDQVAVDLVMGHSDSSMASNYRHSISNERLRDVVSVVRSWLWPACKSPEN